MQLPNAHAAVVDEEKVTMYLLNLAHPDGAGKARFFVALGFNAPEWRVLAESLRAHGLRNPVIETVESQYGNRIL